MDLITLIYGFVLALGTGQFIVHDTTEIDPHTIEIDVETAGLRENKRYILLVKDGKVTQQARVPLAQEECKHPH